MPVIVTTLVAIGLQAASYLARRAGKTAATRPDDPSSGRAGHADARPADRAASLPIDANRRAA